MLGDGATESIDVSTDKTKATHSRGCQKKEGAYL